MGLPKIILLSIALLSTVCMLVESSPVASPDEIKNLDDLGKAWHENKAIEFETGDGKKIELSTRDVILIAVASFLVIFILFCCIGYCFCECVKSLICCICCCGRD